MKKIKQAFAKAAGRFRSSSFRKKFAIAGGAAATAALATEMLIMPAVMAPKLQNRLDTAIAANDGAKVEQVMDSWYATSMWGGSDSYGNNEKAFLAGRIAAAARGHDYAALDTLLKHDPNPFTQGGRRSDSLFVFVSYDATWDNSDWRAATLGDALKNANTKALDVYFANGLKLDENKDRIGVIANSKELIDYFLVQHPDKIALSTGGSYSFERKSPDLLAYIINNASAENAIYAIDRAPDIRGTPGYDDKDLPGQPLAAALARTGWSKDAAERKDSLLIVETLLKRGAGVKTPILDQRDDYYRRSYESPLLFSLKHGSPEATKLLVQAGGDADAVLQQLVRDNQNPYELPGWDASVKAAAGAETRQLLALADQQREFMAKMPKQAPGPR